MKKRARIFLISILIVFAAFALFAGCRSNAVKFDSEKYIFYLSDATRTLQPKVTTRPKGTSYTLTSSNPSIVRVLEDGVTLEALRAGMANITAETEKGSARAQALVYDSPESPEVPPADDGKISVIFESPYAPVESQRVEPGACAVRPPDPVRSGYYFAGWYTDAALTLPYDFSRPVTATLRLYAKWDPAPAEFLFRYLSDTTASVEGLKYAEAYEELTIPETADGRTVVAIGANAFRSNAAIKRVKLPSTLNKIGDYAFSGCGSLETLEGTENLVSIGEGAFWGDANLRAFPLGESLTELKGAAFSGCASLSYTSLPSAITVLEQQLFENSGIRSFDLSGIKEVKKKCFYGSTLLEITGTEDLERVETQAFYNTEWMQAQYEKSADHVIYLDDILLYLDYSDRTDITIKEGVRLIANYAFYHYDQAGVELTIRLPSVPPELSVVHNTTIDREEAAIPVASSSTLVTLVCRDEESFARYRSAPVWSNFYLSPEREYTSARESMYWLLESPIEGLNLFTRLAPSADGTNPTKWIAVSKYTGRAKTFDLERVLDAAYPGGYRVRRIITTAFASLPDLETLIVPAAVDKYERNAVNHCVKLQRLVIAPARSDKYPNPNQLYAENNGRSFSVLPASFRILVPEAEYDSYRGKSGFTYAYALELLESYTPEQLSEFREGV